ncbi:MAG: PEP-utilizing enzyme [Acidimicrobiales bacterium]
MTKSSTVGPVPYPRWIVEDELTPRFPIWTRGNAGEVFPNVVSALGGTIYADAPAVGHRRNMARMGLFTDDEIRRHGIVVSGVFGGYLYLNMSVFRLMGVRTPGMTPEMIDEQGLGVSDAPPYRPMAGDRSVGASLGLTRWAMGALFRPDLALVEAFRRRADSWVASLPDIRSASDAELVALVPTFSARIADAFVPLGHATAIGGVGRSALEQMLRRGTNGDPVLLVNRMTAGLGTIESALPAGRLWRIGRMVAADPALTALFEDGIDTVAEALQATPVDDGIASFAAAFASFLRDHGHRGPDEYELAAPSWALAPPIALALVDRLRLAPLERDPELVAARLAHDRAAAVGDAAALVARPLRPMLRRALHVTELGAAAREQAKDAMVRELAGMKNVLHELARRARDRGGPTDLRDAFLVTADELAVFVASPADFAEVIAERREQRDYRQARVPPFWFEGEVTDPSTWPLRVNDPDSDTDAKAEPTPAVLRGMGVCPGVAEGRARVVLDPADPRGLEPDEILVAPITDPAWTPLFLGAAAVVVEVGAQQSHAAIVARELGIPAVVSVTGATRLIADGTWLRVDANVGEVHIDRTR